MPGVAILGELIAPVSTARETQVRAIMANLGKHLVGALYYPPFAGEEVEAEEVKVPTLVRRLGAMGQASHLGCLAPAAHALLLPGYFW